MAEYCVDLLAKWWRLVELRTSREARLEEIVKRTLDAERRKNDSQYMGVTTAEHCSA
jgi:hypothetical protein